MGIDLHIAGGEDYYKSMQRHMYPAPAPQPTIRTAGEMEKRANDAAAILGSLRTQTTSNQQAKSRVSK
jgi:hypothetical protein